MGLSSHIHWEGVLYAEIEEEIYLNILEVMVEVLKEKYAYDETEDEEPLVTGNPIINEPSYFKLFKCGKTSWTIFMPCVNERAWQPKRISTIRKYVIT